MMLLILTGSTPRSLSNASTAASVSDMLVGGSATRSGYSLSSPMLSSVLTVTARLVSSDISELMSSCLVELGAVAELLSPSDWVTYSRPVFTRMSASAR